LTQVRDGIAQHAGVILRIRTWPRCSRCCSAIRCRARTARARTAATGLGTLGQHLPQGANATLLRSTAFFAGAARGAAVTVLTCWAVAWVVLIVIAGLRRRA
jgi:hypothetical protein